MLILICVCLQYWKSYGDCAQEKRRRSFPVESPSSLCHFCSSRISSYVWWFFLPHCASYLKRGQLNWSFTLSTMGTKIKGIYKGFKYSLSQIFVVKEREIEIGYPTDVKHVAHIGWDGPSGNAPIWMNEFRTVPDFTATSIGNSGSALSPWSSQDYGESTKQQQSGSEMLKDIIPSAGLPSIKKKQKRKKSKSTSSPKSTSSHSSRTSRAAKSKSKLVGEGSTKPANIQVV